MALKQRTLTALVLAPFAVAIVLLLPTPALVFIVALMLLVALWEWTRLSGLHSRPVRAVLVTVATLMIALSWIVRDEPIAWWIVLAGVAWWAVAAFWLGHFAFGAAPTRENATLKLVAGLFAIVPAWLALVKLHSNPQHGPAWALLSLVLVWAADTFAYFAGSRWGKKKLSPRISPNKTYAGVWGALAGGALVALAGGWLLGERGIALVALVVVALVTIVASIVGDLFESLVKRQANVKDSGRFFPGHGGMFDRFDSMFAAVPVFAIGKALLDLAFGP